MTNGGRGGVVESSVAVGADHPGGPTVGAKGIALEQRIAIAALTTAVLVLLLATSLFLFEQWRMETADIDHGLDVLTHILAQKIAPEVGAHDLGAVQSTLDAVAAAPAIRDAEVVTPDGVVLARMKTPLAASLDGPPSQYRVALIYDGRHIADLVLRARPPPFQRVLPRYIAVCGALFFAAVGLALLAGRALARRVVQPVNAVSAAMREAADSGDYSRRLPEWARDEFGTLTDSFNQLLAQLQANDAALLRALSDLTQARDEAQTVNVLKSQFLANMSHEIRTPLNGVLAMAQIMARSDLPPEQRSRVEVIRRSGEELLAVLNDILDLSRIEGDMLALEDKPFTLAELKASLLAVHGPVAAEKRGVALNIELGPGSDGVRRGDLARVAQILNNLISNALKFTPRGQVRVVLDGFGPEGREGVRFEVEDTGVGIPAAVLPRLFQKFSQADGSNTRRYGGAGLGLAICRELTRRMGGRIEVDSVEGQGSTFTVVLPLAAAQPGQSVQSLGADHPLRVLAAEDIPTNQLVLRTVLHVFGVELSMVGDGAEAVEAWRQGDFDLILMDIQMPQMDGVAATRAIRQAEAAMGRPHTPIIAVSANSLPHQVRTYLAAGMDAHVAKPIGMDSLHEAMAKVLGGRAEGRLLGGRD